MTDDASKGGRPRLYDDPVLFEAKIEQYFDLCEEKGRIPTIAGLAYELGFVSRQSILDYERDERFSGAVSRARLRIEADRSERLVHKEKYTPGLPMDLASNHGWVTGRGEVSGRGGRPIEHVDLSRLTAEELEVYGRLAAKAAGLDPDTAQPADV